MSEPRTELRSVADSGVSCPPMPGERHRQAERSLNISIVVTGVRCTLTYLVLPFVVPLFRIAPGVGPTLGLAIGAVAIVANAVSLWRFWRVRHPRRRLMTVIHIGVILFLLVLAAIDIKVLAA